MFKYSPTEADWEMWRREDSVAEAEGSVAEAEGSVGRQAQSATPSPAPASSSSSDSDDDGETCALRPAPKQDL